ncbi:MAG: hypothetical protein KGL95_03820 [Patescibacteria group bacterium]|nr:hypothetical protein [Patescibacteria group bacterium]
MIVPVTDTYTKAFNPPKCLKLKDSKNGQMWCTDSGDVCLYTASHSFPNMELDGKTFQVSQWIIKTPSDNPFTWTIPANQTVLAQQYDCWNNYCHVDGSQYPVYMFFPVSNGNPNPTKTPPPPPPPGTVCSTSDIKGCRDSKSNSGWCEAWDGYESQYQHGYCEPYSGSNTVPRVKVFHFENGSWKFKYYQGGSYQNQCGWNNQCAIYCTCSAGASCSDGTWCENYANECVNKVPAFNVFKCVNSKWQKLNYKDVPTYQNRCFADPNSCPIPTNVPTPTNTPVPTITNTPTPTTIITPTDTPQPTSIPTIPQPELTPSVSPTPIQSPLATTGTLSVSFEDLSQFPKHSVRQLVLYFFTSNDSTFSHPQYVSHPGLVTYNPGTGQFASSSFSLEGIQSGSYIILVKSMQGSLASQIGSYPITITADTNNVLDTTINAPVLKMGDVITTGDSFNVVDILDMSAFLDCFADKHNQPSCLIHGTYYNAPADSLFDLNDDGYIDGTDYSILLQNFQVTSIGGNSLSH